MAVRREHAEHLERATAEAEALGSDQRRTEREKAVLAAQLKGLGERREGAVAASRRDGERYQELEREYEALQLKHRDQILALSEATTSRDHLESSVEILEKDAAALLASNERLQAERDEALRAAAQAREETDSAVTGTKAHMLSLLDSERASWRSMAGRTERKHQASGCAPAAFARATAPHRNAAAVV